MKTFKRFLFVLFSLMSLIDWLNNLFHRSIMFHFNFADDAEFRNPPYVCTYPKFVDVNFLTCNRSLTDGFISCVTLESFI